METNNTLSSYGITQPAPTESVENTELQDGLAGYVKTQFQRAQDHRRAIGIDARLSRNLHANKCEYTPDEAGLLDADTQVYIGLCALKATAAQSWLTDIILNNIDRPWTLEPTPIPNLPDTAKEQVIDLLVAELSSLQTEIDVKERAKELKTVALDQAQEIADNAANKMELVIADQLIEGSFSPTFIQVIEDISIYPATFVRGVYEASKTVAKWDGDTFAAEQKAIPDCRIISPWDAYPSPTSTTTQDGEFFIELIGLLPSQLYDSMKIKGFDEVNIRRALECYDSGYVIDTTVNNERDRLEGKEQGTTAQKATIDTIVYNGLVPGKWLIAHNVLVADPQKHYEAEIWVSGDYVVKAALNPNLLNKRPIHSTSFIKGNRSIWGRSVIDLVYDCQRICNAAARSMVKNMAFASGPMFEAISERIEGNPTELYPYKVFLVKPDLSGTGGPAIRSIAVDSVLNELMALFERFLKVADDLSGIPAYVLGNPQVAGAGRTMGGLSMLMGNAAKSIKNVQLNIDREVITPLVESYYVYNMQVSKDKSIKADAKVVARGATGLMQRELAQSRLVEVLNILIPLVPMWDNLPGGVKVILREMLKQTGLPVDDIIEDPQKREELVAKMRELAQNEAFQRGTGSPVELPPQSQVSPTNVNPQPMPLAMPGPA